MTPFGFGNGGIGPDEPDENGGGPNFNEIFAGLANFGFNPQALFAAANGNAPLISQETLRDLSRRVIKNDRPIGNIDLVASQVSAVDVNELVLNLLASAFVIVVA